MFEWSLVLAAAHATKGHLSDAFSFCRTVAHLCPLFGEGEDPQLFP